MKGEHGPLPCFRYVLGSDKSLVEASVIGPESHNVLRMVSAMRGQTLKLSKARWNGVRKQLEHTSDAVLVTAPEYEEESEDAKFPLGSFTDVPQAVTWTRISLEGFVIALGEPDRRQDGKFSRYMSLSNTMAQGIFLRIVLSETDGMDFLEGGLHIMVQFGKVNGAAGVYADTIDLAQIEATGMDSALRPDPETVQPIS